MRVGLDIQVDQQSIRHINATLDQLLEAAAFRALDVAKMLTPARGQSRYSTGQLRESLRVQKTGDLEYTLFCPRPYGIFVEYGTGPRGAATHHVEGFNNDPPLTYHSGIVLVTRHRGHILAEPYERHTQGMVAQPFIRPALLAGYDKLMELLKS